MTPRRAETESHFNAFEIFKFILPILLSIGGAVWFAQVSMERELAVVRATEQNHFDEIQRTLGRIEKWMERQEAAERK